MWLLYAEAFGAMLILILIVWWTMFHGRHKGEREGRRVHPVPPTARSPQDADAPARPAADGD